jgi:hypothetical protein
MLQIQFYQNKHDTEQFHGNIDLNNIHGSAVSTANFPYAPNIYNAIKSDSKLASINRLNS